MFGNHGLGGLLEEGAHEKSPKCLGGNLGDFGEFCKGLKWFHNDDSARQQYTFLRTLPKLPEKLIWKTIDNSFVEMTQALLDELSLKLIADEQADFANAERHRAAMLKADNPLDYDYSAGWTQPAPEFQAA